MTDVTREKSLTTYRDALVLALRLQEVPADRIGEIAAEVDSHVRETGEDPTEVFGTPRAYAKSLVDEHRKPPLWWTALTLVLSAAAGVLIGQGALGGLLGEPWLGRSGWFWLAIGLVLAVPPAVMVARRSREVRDPRTGQPMVPTPRWAPFALVGIPLAIVLLAWAAVEWAN